MPKKKPNELKQCLKRLYTHGDYSDLTILCGGREFHVHKALVCPQSAFFTAACQAFGGGQEQVIDLPDDDPIAVEIVLYYLYHQEYHIPRQATSGQQSNQEGIGETPIPAPDVSTDATLDEMAADSASLESGSRTMPVGPALHAAVYALARKCSIERLESTALRKFKETATQCWDSDDFLEMAKKTYISTAETDQGLKDALVTVLHEHPLLLGKERTQVLLKEINMLAYDLVMYGYSLQSMKGGHA
ncbi:BTB/POZ protein [Xylariaceae sp. FL1272]|nr:BTB/POZ protein [Xylariaceae sp. FL1272]